MTRFKVYLASPLGFSPEMGSYRGKIVRRLIDLGCEVFDPWAQDGFAADIEKAFGIPDFAGRAAAFAEIASGIGALNEAGIRNSDILLGVLDGAEIDSGTAGEIGFAAALGKPCYALRTDLRDSGDFSGLPVNLQILHFIALNGGRLFRNIDDIRFRI